MKWYHSLVFTLNNKESEHMHRLSHSQSISLESMRGISAIVVVLCHSFQIFVARYASDYFNYVVMAAQASVMVFFVLSGFLIGKSIQSNININKKFDLLAYLKNRLIRIYPPLLLSIILVYLLAFLAPYFFESKNVLMKNPDSWLENINLLFNSNQIISAITFTNGILPVSTPFNTPLWSLPIEVWYYIVVGLFFTRNPIFVILSICIFLLMSSAKYEFFMYSFVWFSGFMTSLVNPKSKLALILYTSILSVFISLCLKFGYEYNMNKNTIHYYNLFFGLSFCCFVYIYIIRLDKNIRIIPSSSYYSYTLYLIHIPVMIFIAGVFESSVLLDYKVSIILALLSVVTCIVIAKYSSGIVENKRKINELLSWK